MFCFAAGSPDTHVPGFGVGSDAYTPYRGESQRASPTQTPNKSARQSPHVSPSMVPSDKTREMTGSEHVIEMQQHKLIMFEVWSLWRKHVWHCLQVLSEGVQNV